MKMLVHGLGPTRWSDDLGVDWFPRRKHYHLFLSTFPAIFASITFAILPLDETLHFKRLLVTCRGDRVRVVIIFFWHFCIVANFIKTIRFLFG